MALRKITPCDYSGFCPYNSETYGSCEYWCGEVVPQDTYDHDTDETDDA